MVSNRRPRRRSAAYTHGHKGGEGEKGRTRISGRTRSVEFFLFSVKPSVRFCMCRQLHFNIGIDGGGGCAPTGWRIVRRAQLGKGNEFW